MNIENITIRRRVAILTWLLPLSLAFLVVLFYLGSARWLQAKGNVGNLYYGASLFYAAAVAVLTFWVLRQIGLWLGETNQSQSQIEGETERLAQISKSSTDAILSVNAEVSIDSWNYGAERLFGFLAVDALGSSFSALLGDNSSAEVESRWLVGEVQRTGSLRGHETTCLDVNGQRIDVELTATLLTDHRGAPDGMSVIMRDINRRKHREEETQRLNTILNTQAAERNYELAVKVQEIGRANSELHKLDETRSEFVSLVSHQIRAPLTNMGGAVQRMQRDCKAINPTCARMFAVFEQQVDRLDRLVQDVLNASRLEAGEVSLQPEPISMMPIVRQAANEIRSGTPGRTIHIAEKPGLPLVFADRYRVAEILANLLDNADKYSPPDEKITVQLRADQTEVTVAVRDAGSGIPPQDLERIFDKFYRTDSSDAQTAYGYGLGLYVCRRLVEEQGGRIWAENHPDGGALFSLALPVWQEKHV
jgi:PAS domain S-box-containing protein